jgi:large subunit ribosomal protein L18
MKAKVRSEKQRKWQARRRRVQTRVAAAGRTCLTVFRSSKHMYALLVDPTTGKTIATVSTRSPEIANGLSSTANVEAAKRVGAAIAKVAKEKQIDRVVFNRNGFLYHGRVKALADAAREAGLQF